MKQALALVMGGGIGLAGCTSAPSNAEPDAGMAEPDAHEMVDTTPLSIEALGVSGFVLRRGGDAVLTAPLFTRQRAIDVALNLPLQSDTAKIDAGMAGVVMTDIKAIVSGHAHFDHFMDVPHIMSKAPSSIAYTNLSGRHMLSALAPDRPGCTNALQGPMLSRDRVIAVDDQLASFVDYTNCPSLKPAGAPLEGRWMSVPGSNVRLMPVCSVHPAQIGPYHFGEGSVDEDQCQLPGAAAEWLEGLTIAFLIDFLDATGEPAFRVFYQDAPTDSPIGHVPLTVLNDKAVDVALLCVGSADAVENHPTEIVGNIKPRFALSSHWEDFFNEPGPTPDPIPFLDLEGYIARAEAALPLPADAQLVVDGWEQDVRHVLVQPGTSFEVPMDPTLTK